MRSSGPVGGLTATCPTVYRTNFDEGDVVTSREQLLKVVDALLWAARMNLQQFVPSDSTSLLELVEKQQELARMYLKRVEMIEREHDDNAND